MTSPHVAADPVGGQMVARLFEQLAQADPSRIGRLLSPQPGPAAFEVEVHRTGDIVPESVIRDLTAGAAIREAAARSRDPMRSVELVVVPADSDDEVVLAARPGQPLSYLFTDDVRARAAVLPPPATATGPLTGPVPIVPPSRSTSEHAYADDADDGYEVDDAAHTDERHGAGHALRMPSVASSDLVPAPAGSHPVTSGELTAAIEAALAEMSIQVDVAGVAELVSEAVAGQLSTVALRSEGAPAAQGGVVPALDEELRRVQEEFRDQSLQQFAVLAAQMQRSEAAVASLAEQLAESQRRPRAEAAELAELHAGLRDAVRMLAAVERDRQADVSGDLSRLERNLEGELRLLGRQVETHVSSALQRRADRPGADDLTRLAGDLGVVTERLGALVRHLDASVDVRSLGRLTRSLERTAARLGVNDDTGGFDEVEHLAGRRTRRDASAGHHPLRLVDDPASDTGA
jgi:hypothetical protein